MLSRRLFLTVFFCLCFFPLPVHADDKNCISNRGTTHADSFVDLAAKQLIDVVNACSSIRILPTLSLPGEVVKLESTVARTVNPARGPANASTLASTKEKFQSSWKVVCCPVANQKPRPSQLPR